MKIAINIVIYQICWLGCIIGAANMQPLVGVGLVAGAVAYHLYSASRPSSEIVLILITAAVGAVWDSLLVAAGWLVYPSGTLLAGTAPYWIVALWISFATTFNVSLRWFKQRLMWASLFGALGGPLAFLAGERLGGVVFTDYVAGLGALALGWALLMPLVLLLANRWDGFQTETPTAASAIAESRG